MDETDRTVVNLLNIAGLSMRNPVMLAAGTCGANIDMMQKAYDAGAGAIVTKSITVRPRKSAGRTTTTKDITYDEKSGGYLNAIGLVNQGVYEFANILTGVSVTVDYPIVASLAGHTPTDFTEMIGVLDAAVDAFELNLSCPNAKNFDVGNDSQLASDMTKAAVACTDKPIFVKIAYHHVISSLDSVVNAGCDGIVAINTIPATAVSPRQGNPIFGVNAGGLSGPPIKPIAMRAVCDILDRYPDMPVIGCGGITSSEDAAEFLQAGAAAVQVGSHAMVHGVQVLGEIAEGLS